jgi:hypothetical protein
MKQSRKEQVNIWDEERFIKKAQAIKFTKTHLSEHTPPPARCAIYRFYSGLSRSTKTPDDSAQEFPPGPHSQTINQSGHNKGWDDPTQQQLQYPTDMARKVKRYKRQGESVARIGIISMPYYPRKSS